MSRPDELLVGLGRSLDQVEALLAAGRARYDADAVSRLALQRLWITIGNFAEQYRLAAGLAEDTPPWTELYVYRCVLAHALPEELDDARIWHETAQDLNRIRSAVASA